MALAREICIVNIVKGNRCVVIKTRAINLFNAKLRLKSFSLARGQFTFRFVVHKSHCKQLSYVQRNNRQVGRPGPLPPRNHHNWGARLGRRREELKYKEPTTLAEMEELACKSTLLMEKHGGKSEHHFHTAMDLLRQQYNMNFIMICEKCNSPHVYDEVTAPER
ncbi:uncharacterized protein LOC123872501 [Maniola jurtina]|uniref:uncharacterized protein LOC123872501 n=1 Tax=Maniola jurtina TaxID=191418 RepID=UPI001E68663E|nr:uncharacterized protein LOC123872501 [Maniola jurtina]